MDLNYDGKNVLDSSHLIGAQRIQKFLIERRERRIRLAELKACRKEGLSSFLASFHKNKSNSPIASNLGVGARFPIDGQNINPEIQLPNLLKRIDSN